jgi:hypothetical protein
VVESITQEEIDALAELEIDRSIDIDLNNRELDGEAFFIKVRRKIRRFYNDGNINQAQYKTIRTTLQPVLQPLRYGDWDVCQDNINAISRPNGQMGNLYDFLKNQIDQYVTDNY